MLFKRTLILGFAIACSPAVEEPTFSCVRSSDTDISFSIEDMPCVQVRMDERDFIELGAQNRFGGSHEDQLVNAIGHILSSCTEPFPDPFSYFPADIQVNGLL